MSLINKAETDLANARLDRKGLMTRVSEMTLLWKVMSLVIFASAWEIAGRSGL